MALDTRRLGLFLLGAAVLVAPSLDGAPATARELLDKGVSLQKQGKYDEAISVLEEARGVDAPDELAAEIAVEIAKTWFLKGRDASEGKLEGVEHRAALLAAEKHFREVVRAHPKAPRHTPYAAYMVGSCRLLLGDMKSALTAYRSAYMDYPQSRMRAKALVRIGVSLAALGESRKALQIFRAYTQHYPEDKNLEKVKRYMSELQLVGMPAPPLHANEWVNEAAPGGLSDLRGEVVVLLFFATWCKQCSKELPHLKREISHWKDRGVVFLGVANPDDPKATEPVEFYVRKNKVDFFDIALDRGGRNWFRYRVTGLPAAVVIDRKGTVRWRGHLSFMGRNLIEALLDESP